MPFVSFIKNLVGSQTNIRTRKAQVATRAQFKKQRGPATVKMWGYLSIYTHPVLGAYVPSTAEQKLKLF